MVPAAVLDRYNLHPYITHGHVYFEIRKCMYGLPQAGKLSQLRLIDHLSQHGFTQCPNTPCLFRHSTRDITFCLVVDDFGVRYGSKDDADFLIDVLQLKGYELTLKWDGNTYLGMSVTFDRANKTVSLAMPDYITKMLTRFRPHYLNPGHRAAKTPGIYIPPKYGQQEPQLAEVDSSALLSPAQKLEIQGVVGTVLYYARAIDPTLLPVANEIASRQANPTLQVLHATNRLLSYCTAHRNNGLTYHACDMALHIHVDASYLSRSHARSVVGAIFFLGNRLQPTRTNGTIHAISSIIPCVVASAAESEYAAIFAGAQHGAYLSTVLTDLGYPQDPIIIMADNTTAIGIATDSIKQRRSKAVDMRFHWVRDRTRQGQFTIAYINTNENLADYFTKNLDAQRHQRFSTFLVKAISTSTSP